MTVNILNKGTWKENILWKLQVPLVLCWVPWAQKKILANLGWKQNKDLGFLLEILRFLSEINCPQPHKTQNLEWLNFQFLFQQQNWNNFHLYSIRTLCGYSQPPKSNTLIEGNWKLFAQTHQMQLSKIQTTVRNHRWFHTKPFWEWRNEVIALHCSTELSTGGSLRDQNPIKNRRWAWTFLGVITGLGLLLLQSWHGALGYWFARQRNPKKPYKHSQEHLSPASPASADQCRPVQTITDQCCPV